MGTSSPAPDHWSAKDYAGSARFVSDLGAPVLALLDPRPGETILDLGCGDGALTAKIAEAGATVLGVDASPDMVAAARERGLEAEVADAHALVFENRFDAVFSNAAMHWMTRPDAVIEGVARALRGGGRFVAEFGGMGNVATIRTALIAELSRYHDVETDLRDVWYFPTPAEHSALLARFGFEIDEIVLIPRPTPVEAGIEAWLTTLAAPALAKIPEAGRGAAVRRIAALLEPALADESGAWRADYVRLRFKARLPG